MNIIENNKVKELVVMVSNIQIRMITELNMVTNDVKTSDWWLDSGVTVHIYNDKAWFKSYKEFKKTLKGLDGQL
jgi:hypothetical protein